MANARKTYHNIMDRHKDANIKFKDMQNLLNKLGFECRIKGDHFIYSYNDYPDNINIQPIKNMTKPYQVKQIRNFFIKYNIEL